MTDYPAQYVRPGPQNALIDQTDRTYLCPTLQVIEIQTALDSKRAERRGITIIKRRSSKSVPISRKQKREYWPSPRLCARTSEMISPWNLSVRGHGNLRIDGESLAGRMSLEDCIDTHRATRHDLSARVHAVEQRMISYYVMLTQLHSWYIHCLP